MGLKFNEKDFYTSSNSFSLLPFKFLTLDNGKEIIVSEAGDYLIEDGGTVKALINRNIDFDSRLYKRLLANNIVVESYKSGHLDFLANRIRTKRSNLISSSSLHILVLTLRCNHTCHYCQVSRVTENKDQYDMSIVDLENSINLMLAYPSEYITMEFQGGEPLLAFDLLKYAVEYCLAMNHGRKKINFVVCTNGTVYNDEILEFCRKHSILISTSLDGPQHIHDSNRKKTKNSSYEEVLNGLEVFRLYMGKERVSALMTTSRLSLEYPREIIDSYVSNDFNSIFLRPISPYGFALKSPKKNHYDNESFLKFYREALLYIIDINLSGRYFREDFASIILKKILTPGNSQYVDLASPAGAINSVLAYNYDGNVYATDESRMLAEIGDYRFKLGHISEGLNLLKSQNAIDVYKNSLNEGLNGCADCALNLYCGADPVHNYATQGDIYGHRANSTFCSRNMNIILLLISLMDENKEVKSVFRNWINGN